MKFKFASLLLLIVAVMLAGCLKDSNNTVPNDNVAIPPGSYKGDFTLIHINPATLKRDTSGASVAIVLNADMTYSVQGDTTTIQYPSHGTFSLGTDNGNPLITFTDATVNKTTNLNGKKKHLTGPFLYSLQSPRLHIYGSSDTLAYDYNLSQ